MKLAQYANKYSLTLASIPVVLFTFVFALSGLRAKPQVQPQPPPAKPYIEQVNTNDTFATRYGGALPLEVRVRTIPIVKHLEQIEPPTTEVASVEPSVRAVEEPRRRQPTARYHRITRHAGADICTRHNMRKVWVSDKRWRCKR